MPRVSVIIPAHNSAAYLPETIRSVKAQTYTSWEIVAVDDGSSDETWSVLSAAGERVRAFRNHAPRGPAAARNRALAEADGELVVFLDADDLLLPEYLDEQVACLDSARREGRRVGIVTCDAYVLEEQERTEHTYLEGVRDARRPITLERVLERNPIYISSLVPAEAGRAVGWFDEELFGTEDFDLWLKILERGYEAVLNPKPLATYRRRTGSVSSDIARQGANNRRTYELALARGALNRRQRQIARRAIRYNRAMEAVAALRFAPDRSVREVVRMLPLLVWVAVTNPRWWAQWVTVLRTGRAPASARGGGR
jgi:glycosyltransferase involved in cell wall biosynthesis